MGDSPLEKQGFKVLPWRWIVQQTFAWLMRYRPLTIDFEVLTETAEAFNFLQRWSRLWLGD